MSRFGRRERVVFVEEPAYGEAVAPWMHLAEPEPRVTVAVPQMPRGFDAETAQIAERLLLQDLLGELRVHRPVLWHTSPRASEYGGPLQPVATVYDCTSSSLTFEGAGADRVDAEARLLRRADLVFTAGHSLFRGKRAVHPRVHLFPTPIDSPTSSVPVSFGMRLPLSPRPAFPGPGWATSAALTNASTSSSWPSWPADAPGGRSSCSVPSSVCRQRCYPTRTTSTIVGPQPYDSLPSLMAGWDVALVPFKLGPTTRFLHPAKLRAYAAAGCPVVSTAIPEVVEEKGRGMAGVRIAGSPEAFLDEVQAAVEGAVEGSTDITPFLPDLSESWDEVWLGMDRLVGEILARSPSGGSPEPTPIRREAAPSSTPGTA